MELLSLQTADLSVQELVDCDTRYDQGCAGGNPLLAFYFLHRFGVTSAKNYPYKGKQETCQYHKVDKPIATVETWGILTPDHENNMEKVLRYIGPVAVGLVGADPSFLAYKGGVFSVKGGKCDLGHEADHAMLIVGYGEEENRDGTKVCVSLCWLDCCCCALFLLNALCIFICRQSIGSLGIVGKCLLLKQCFLFSSLNKVVHPIYHRGTGWGENGYIRMERIGGRKGSRGVCEIARSPSVALGGMFTKEVELSADYRDLHGSRHGKGHLGSGYSESNPIVTLSSHLGSIIHRIRARLGFVQKGIMLSTLNGR
jgi:hypothetical protein